MYEKKYPFDHLKAIRMLCDADPKLGALIERVGPFTLGRTNYMTSFQALTRSIIYQQLSGKAAKAIHARVLGLFPNRYPSPKHMTRLSEGKLLTAGMSRAKTKAVKDLAQKCDQGIIPTAQGFSRMSDETIIECLSQVHGIGTWTAQMLLIFHIGRPDVLPAGDLGIRKGFKVVYQLRKLPEPKYVLRCGERWRPYRSVASWYLWRAND